MNQLHPHLTTGTVGELVLQLRLLQYDVQAASPLKDTGNDLIAVRGNVFRAIQVKTTATAKGRFSWKNLPQRYHILALVALNGEGNRLHLDSSKIFLLTKNQVAKRSYAVNELGAYSMTAKLVDQLFCEAFEPARSGANKIRR